MHEKIENVVYEFNGFRVDAMRRRATDISADRPGERLPVPPTGDELQRLGTTLNENDNP